MLSPKPWKAESLIRFLMRLFAAYAVVGLLAYAVDGPLGRLFPGTPEETRRMWASVAATLVLQLVTLVLVGWFLKENQMTWAEAFGLRLQGIGRDTGLAAGTLVVLFPVNFGLLWVSQKLLEWRSITPQVQAMVKVVLSASTWGERLLLALTAMVMAPLWEELVFRGIAYPALKQAGFPRLALWSTSLLFAASHLNLLTFLPLVFFGLMMVWLYERSDSLVAPILAHALFNSINFVWVLVGGQAM